MDKKNSKRGFSGLVDLVSDVSGADEDSSQDPLSSSSSPSGNIPGHTASDDREVENKNSSRTDENWTTWTMGQSKRRKTSDSVPPIKTVEKEKSGDGSVKKWFLGIIAIIFVIWLFSNGEQTDKSTLYNSTQPKQTGNTTQSNAPPITSPKKNHKTELQYEKPPVGTNNKLFVPQICWCLRESIRIETMRDLVDSDYGVDVFNKIVEDYNCRCASYQYLQGSLESAQRQVETHRSQIVSEAISDAEILGLTFNPNETSKVSRRPGTKITREAQMLLTELGYDPGPIDGQYGRRTADSVKVFQRDVGTTQDGWIDEDLLSTLRRAKAAYKPPVGSQPKPQTQTSLQPRSSTPSAVTTAKLENLSFEEQSKYGAAQRLRRLGYNVDWRTSSLTDMLDAEARIGTANRLKRNGISVDWRNYSLTQLLNMEYGQN